MIDTHTHLYLPEFGDADGGAAAVERALNVGVDHLIFPNVDLSTIAPMEALAARFPNNISCAMGLHPTEVKEDFEQALAVVLGRLRENRGSYVAVGEVGIDLYWDATFRREQMEVFDRQAAEAAALQLPLIIHCREGLDEVLEVLSAHKDVPAVFHSFGGTAADVERIRSLGDYYFGINGIVTFKNSKLREVLPAIGKDRLLLETDSPYLAPVPQRGKRNESAYLPHIAAHMAAALDIPLHELISDADANTRHLFKLE